MFLPIHTHHFTAVNQMFKQHSDCVPSICFITHLITFFPFRSSLPPVSPRALKVSTENTQHTLVYHLCHTHPYSACCLTVNINRICLPVIQEHQVTPADHLPHCPHLALQSQIVLEGHEDHDPPVRQHKSDT